ncbi:MAG: hypothetical protein SGBAC_008196 [Bacillariaceae sp.]
MSSFNVQFVETTSCCGLRQDASSEVKKDDDVDAILAQGMQRLSFDELQREQEDLHGVSGLIDKENSQEMASLLQDFDDHLQQRKKNTVYESAELLNKAYVTNPDLRMHFLHGNRWDPKAAAEQFLKFLEQKKKLFGMEKVVKDITLDDLDEDDKENLKGGNVSSEAIICKTSLTLISAELKAKTRVHYGSHTECQYRLTTFGIPRVALPFTIIKNDIILEGHLAWYKECLVEEQNPTAFKNSTNKEFEPNPHDVLFAGRKFRGNGNEVLRLRVMQHVPNYNRGSCKERRSIVDAMVEHINSKGGRFLKLDANGSSWVEVSRPEVREKVTQMFRNFRRPRASQQQKTSLPTSNHLPLLDEKDIAPNDVLFGRQVGHDGNQRLKHMVENMAAEYDAATRGRKKQLVDSMVEEIKSSNGRFLRQVEGKKWQQVLDDTVVFSKVSSHFRNYRRNNRERQ